MRTSTTNANEIKKHRLCYKILAAAVWILVWQLASMWLKQEILLASPVSVIKRLTELIAMGDFWKSVVFSFVRIILGFSLALGLAPPADVPTFSISRMFLPSWRSWT